MCNNLFKVWPRNIGMVLFCEKERELVQPNILYHVMYVRNICLIVVFVMPVCVCCARITENW